MMDFPTGKRLISSLLSTLLQQRGRDDKSVTQFHCSRRAPTAFPVLSLRFTAFSRWKEFWCIWIGYTEVVKWGRCQSHTPDKPPECIPLITQYSLLIWNYGCLGLFSSWCLSNTSWTCWGKKSMTEQKLPACLSSMPLPAGGARERDLSRSDNEGLSTLNSLDDMVLFWTLILGRSTSIFVVWKSKEVCWMIVMNSLI